MEELLPSIKAAFTSAFDVDDLMAMENVREICRIVHSKLSKA